MQPVQPRVRLNNGIEMPQLGIGTYGLQGKKAEQAVIDALKIGYRLIDTAAMYGNETDIGKAVQRSGLSRNEIFLTSKINNPDQGYDSTLRAFDVSLGKLRTDYLDLYLIHWPIKGKRRETWNAMEKIYASGKARSIGVANYLVPFLEELSDHSDTIPVVNQVEFSPYLFLEDLLQYCREKRIKLQAYTPLIRGKKNTDPRLLKFAEKYSKTPAQIILRWDIELGVAVIPNLPTRVVFWKILLFSISSYRRKIEIR